MRQGNRCAFRPARRATSLLPGVYATKTNGCDGEAMKTRRILIAPGEVAHIYLVKRQPIVRFYSTVDAAGNGVEQKAIRPGIRATMTIPGGVSINIVVERKKNKR